MSDPDRSDPNGYGARRESDVIGVSFAVVSVPTFGLAAPPAQNSAPARKAKLTKQAAGVTEASVRAHLEFLAGDALNGRGTGTRDEWIAAAYIGAQLRQWGLEPLGDDGGFVQDVQIERSELSTPPVLTFAEHRLTHGKEATVLRRRVNLGAPPEVSAGAGGHQRSGVVVARHSDRRPRRRDGGCRDRHKPRERQARTRRLSGQPPGTRPLMLQRIVGVPGARPLRSTESVRRDGGAPPRRTSVALEADVPSLPTSLTLERDRTSDRQRSAVGVMKSFLLSAHLDHLGARTPANEHQRAPTGRHHLQRG